MIGHNKPRARVHPEYLEYRKNIKNILGLSSETDVDLIIKRQMQQIDLKKKIKDKKWPLL